jgi:phosphoglycolate phosphatase/putative hydrolase of the HAD superfamily
MQNKETDLLTTYDLFIFDLDGTLYDQQKLRNIMLAELIFRFFTFRISLRKLKIINRFRKLREQKLGFESPAIHDEQFRWCAESLDIPVSEVRPVIEHWMLDYPLRHLRQARYPKVKSFFLELKKQGRNIAVYSDFPVDDKLKALRLEADKTFCSTDDRIAQLKPSKKGTQTICQAFGCPAEKTIFFGDRLDTDGESARMARVRFIHVDPRMARKGRFYRRLLNQIIHQDGQS